MITLLGVVFAIVLGVFLAWITKNELPISSTAKKIIYVVIFIIVALWCAHWINGHALPSLPKV